MRRDGICMLIVVAVLILVALWVVDNRLEEAEESMRMEAFCLHNCVKESVAINTRLLEVVEDRPEKVWYIDGRIYEDLHKEE